MTILLNLDREEANIMLAAADAAHAIINARVQRVDPGGHIKTALGMSETKLQRVKRQLSTPSVLSWEKLPDDVRGKIFMAMEDLLSSNGEVEQAAFFDKLTSAILTNGVVNENPDQPAKERARSQNKSRAQKPQKKRAAR